MPERENAAAKARRYLAEGRVNLLRVALPDVVARVRGDHATTYTVSHSRGRWSCDCPARTTCAHLLAVQLVVVVQRSQASASR